MRFHSAVSDDESSTRAVEQLIAQARNATGGKIDVAFAFFTIHHNDHAEEMIERLWLELDPQAIIGCSAEGVIGADREIERAPGMSLLVGEMPGVRLRPFHIKADEWASLLADEPLMSERIGAGSETRAVIAFGDPYTTPITKLLTTMDAMIPGAPLIGGMASGVRSRGANILLRNDRIYNDGLVGMSLSGPLEVDTIVSQGCRPIGRPMVITRANGNIIEQLGGRAPLDVLREVANDLPDEDKLLLQDGLLIGRAISEYRERWGRGDFLVRNLVGANEETGALGVNDYVRTGQTVQFHVRDAATAEEDLELLLDVQKIDEPAAGGLLFSCNGRGTNLFEEPCHDIAASQRAMPKTPIAGFFAAGELGPVGGKNFIHGHTASFALFREAK